MRSLKVIGQDCMELCTKYCSTIFFDCAISTISPEVLTPSGTFTLPQYVMLIRNPVRGYMLKVKVNFCSYWQKHSKGEESGGKDRFLDLVPLTLCWNMKLEKRVKR